MVDDRFLVRIVQDFISSRSEGVYWDFKARHHAAKEDLIHDVLCLANADHDGPRFLVFGVRNADFSVSSIDATEGRRTQGQIAGLFRDNAGKFFQSRFPTFRLREIEIDGALVDVLVIEDEPKKPYYLVERIAKVPANHIYTRVCDTNTPVTDAAQPHEIERMWRERFGLDASALERAKRCLGEPGRWSMRDEEGFVCCHHDVSPEFTLRAADADDLMDSGQEWTRGEIRTDDNYAGWYELRCHQTLLRRIHYVGFDNHKKSMVAPHWEAIGRGRLYYYAAESVDYAVQRFWTSQEGQDDSRGLRIRGDGDSVREGRSRWPGGIDIPVLERGELDAFLEGATLARRPQPGTDFGPRQAVRTVPAKHPRSRRLAPSRSLTAAAGRGVPVVIECIHRI